MTFPHVDSPAAWRVSEIEQDKSWVFRLDNAARAELAGAVKAAFDADRPLFDYRGRDIDLGPAGDVIAAAMMEAHAGRGIALVKGLPRDEVTEQEFRFMNWAIGLHFGVARPQGIPYYGQPLFDMAEGHMFGKWNRNRVRTAQDIAGVPQLTDAQKECTDLLDEILRRPDVMFTMWLEPGDLQIMNNHVMLHSRTPFEDFEEEGRQRLLYRLWLATPNSLRLPESWGGYFRSIEPGTVRGGIRGHEYDDERLAFETRQAADLGMPAPARERFIPNRLAS